MKSIKILTTSEIMSYLDAITVMDDELDRAVRLAYRSFGFEGITELEKDDILEKLKAEAERIEPVRLAMVKEITRRFKHNFGLSKGPFEISTTIKALVDKYPMFPLNETEIKLVKGKKAKANLKKA